MFPPHRFSGYVRHERGRIRSTYKVGQGDGCLSSNASDCDHMTGTLRPGLNPSDTG